MTAGPVDFLHGQIAREGRRALAWLAVAMLAGAAAVGCGAVASGPLAVLLGAKLTALASFALREYLRHDRREEKLVHAVSVVDVGLTGGMTADGVAIVDQAFRGDAVG